MPNNYKHLYEQMKQMVEMYQDELVPGLRKKIEELEQNRVEVVRCAQCKYQRDLNRSDWYEDSFAEGILWCLNQSEAVRPDDFCSCGERSEGNEV